MLKTYAEKLPALLQEYSNLASTNFDDDNCDKAKIVKTRMNNPLCQIVDQHLYDSETIREEQIIPFKPLPLDDLSEISSETLDEARKVGLFDDLYDYGNFDIKELAAIIKMLYTFAYEEEFKISTFFMPYTSTINGYKRPYMHFVIGSIENDENAEFNEEFPWFPQSEDINTLAPFINYNGQMFQPDYEEGIPAGEMWEYYHERDCDPYDDTVIPKGKQCLVILSQSGTTNTHEDLSAAENLIGINGQYMSNLDRKKFSQLDGVFYYHGVKDRWNNAKPVRVAFSNKFNIFRKRTSISRLLDISSIPLVSDDDFIFKALFSIAVYKKNNNRHGSLTPEEYNHIFQVLYGKDVDIDKIITKEIPTKLKAVGKKKYMHRV